MLDLYEYIFSICRGDCIVNATFSASEFRGDEFVTRRRQRIILTMCKTVRVDCVTDCLLISLSRYALYDYTIYSECSKHIRAFRSIHPPAARLHD